MKKMHTGMHSMRPARSAPKPTTSAVVPTPATTAASTAPTNVQEFTIRAPKNVKNTHHVMRFNATLNVDFGKWRNVRMERENNMRDMRGMDEDMPKFGAGSEYNRESREEMRRKKYGIAMKKYKPEAQPWILKVDGKSGKKFRGSREGGIGENAAFYVFTHAPDGAIDAYPLHEWYNFQPVNRYKSLSAEEAEAEFGQRNKTMNYFSLMFRKRLRGDVAEDPEEMELKKISGKKGKPELKISDEWMDSDDDSNSSGDDDGVGKKKEGDSDDEGTQRRKNRSEKEKKKDVHDEAYDDSDDGDQECRELDYISDSTDGDSDQEAKANKEMKSVAEEDALRKLLTSDEESDSEESESEEAENTKAQHTQTKDKKKKRLTEKHTDLKKESLGDLSSDSSHSDSNQKPSKLKNLIGSNSRSGSRPESPSVPTLLGGNSSSNPNKHKMTSLPIDSSSDGGSENSSSTTVTPTKKAKHNTPPPTSFSGIVVSGSRDDTEITEEAVRRYLMRKPMAATELLAKFKSKMTGSREKFVDTLTQILKKINPHKQTIQGKIYWSIKQNK